MRVEDLETPAPVIDLDRVEHNLAKLQAYCDSHDLRLRPHIKTHKMRAFARRQVELGACGITYQKLGEAEVMVDAGLDDILISYPLIGPAKALRLAALARRAKMSVAVDNPLALETAAQAARAAGSPIGVLVEFDSGNKRTGVVSVDQALDLARRTGEAEGLRFDGLISYPSTAATAAFVAEAKRRFDEAGITISVVSGGGPPNAWHAHEVAGLTEVRVRTYIYHDRATVGAGATSTRGVRAPAPRNRREPTDRGPGGDRCGHEEPHERSRRTFGRAGIWADPGLSGRRDRAPERRARRGGSFPLRREAGAWGACQDRAESCVRREQFARRGRDEPRRPGGRYVAHGRAGKDTVVLRLILLVRASMCELGPSLGRARTIDPRIIMRSKLRSGRPGE